MDIGSEHKQVFEARHFDSFRKLVAEHTGIKLTEAKVEMVYRRFAPRIKKLGLTDFGDYCEILKSHDSDELIHFSNLITTNHTSFFRENHHFEFLRDICLPKLKQANARTRRIRIWSAGCATGEEAYSLAMVLGEAIPDLENWDARILATDLNTQCLETAEQGIYTDKALNGVSSLRLKRWFNQTGANGSTRFQAVPELKSLVAFKHLNLIDPWPFSGQFDIIVCRNVMIYFDKHTQKRLIEKFAKHQQAGDTLIIGHSESITMVSDAYRLDGQTVYTKATAAGARQ